MFRSRFSHSDFFVMLSVLCLALLLLLLPFLSKKDSAFLTVTTDQGTVSYPLSENGRIPLQSGGHSLTLEILDGKARVLESDCPDQVCVLSGWISKVGESVICAPAGVRLLISSEGGENDDFIAG